MLRPPWRLTICADELALRADVVLGALVADERQAHGLEVEVAAPLQVLVRALDLTRSIGDGSFLVAKENCVSFASDTRVTDGDASLAAMSCIAARALGQSGKR